MKFGDYANIEQKRFGEANEMYTHKVIGTSWSNSWVDVPVECLSTETLHDEMGPVVSCIVCGINERQVFYYRLEDCIKCEPNKQNKQNEIT